jgi:hypothetical protein
MWQAYAMVSRSSRIKILLIVLAVLVLFIPFLYPLSTCRIEKQQLHMSVAFTRWIVGPEGGILTMKITIENSAGCDANVESLQFTMYRLIYPDNTTEDVSLNDTQLIGTTIPAGGNFTTNFAFEQPFSVGPRSVLMKITVILQDGSSLEVFDGPIDTTVQQKP